MSCTTYLELLSKVGRSSAALRSDLNVGEGDRIALLLPNTPTMLELHYAIPGVGAILVPMNTRLHPTDYEYVLFHSGARVLIASESLREVVEPTLSSLRRRGTRVVWTGSSQSEWDQMIESADPLSLERPLNENALLSINYTSGTTGKPKGAMTTHRGAYLHSLGVIVEAGIDTTSNYLWTLPMFHCNGWAFVWAVTAAGASHTCMDRVDAPSIWQRLAAGEVTHMCTAPTVLGMIIGAEEAVPLAQPVRVFVGGAPPSPNLLARARELISAITHLYGLTETYGPIGICAWHPEWDVLSIHDQDLLRARQGVGTVVSEKIRVVREDMTDVPADGKSEGEIVTHGNNVMVGYYQDRTATKAAFRGGWFHTGDLAVLHPDNRVQIRDRIKT